MPNDPRQTILKAAFSRLYHTIMLAWKKKSKIYVFKLNIDGNRSGVSENISAGGVIRNHCADWIASFEVNLGIGEI